MTIDQLNKIKDAVCENFKPSQSAIVKAAQLLGHKTQRGTEIRQTHQVESWARLKKEQKKSKS